MAFYHGYKSYSACSLLNQTNTKHTVCNIRLCLLRSELFHSSAHKLKKQEIQYGLNKLDRRLLRRRLNLANEKVVKEKHIYKNSCSVDNKFDLANYLKSTEIYNEDGLIALNKPYGISRYEEIKKEEGDGKINILQTINSSGYLPAPLSVEAALPVLRKLYNEDKLEVLLCPERWSSGVLLFSKTDKASNMVKMSIKRSIAKQMPNRCYWTVTSGLSEPIAAGEKVATYLKYAEGFDHVPVIKKNYSKKEVMKGIAKPNVVEHKVLAYRKEYDAGLVEINVLNNRRHFLRVWMAHCSSPILGDLLYSGRVKTIMGKKVLLKPHQLNSYQPPELSKHLLEKLNLSPGLSEIIPCHIHLSKIKLDTYCEKIDLEITAPPPDHFMWTCKQLGLMDDSAAVSVVDQNYSMLVEDDIEDLLVDNQR